MFLNRQKRARRGEDESGWGRRPYVGRCPAASRSAYRYVSRSVGYASGRNSSDKNMSVPRAPSSVFYSPPASSTACPTDIAAQLGAAFFGRPGYPAVRYTFRPAFTRGAPGGQQRAVRGCGSGAEPFGLQFSQCHVEGCPILKGCSMKTKSFLETFESKWTLSPDSGGLKFDATKPPLQAGRQASGIHTRKQGRLPRRLTSRSSAGKAMQNCHRPGYPLID